MSEQPTSPVEANLVSGIDSVEINSVQIDLVPILFVGIKNEDLFNENQVLAEKLVEERLVKLTEKYNWDDETIQAQAALVLDHIEMLKNEATFSKKLENEESLTGRLKEYWAVSKAYLATKMTMTSIDVAKKVKPKYDTNNPNIIKNPRTRTLVGVGIALVGLFALKYGIQLKLNAESVQALGDNANILDLDTLPITNTGSEDTLNSLDLNLPNIEESPNIDSGASLPDSPLLPTDTNNIDSSGVDGGFGGDTSNSGPDSSYGNSNNSTDSLNQGSDIDNTSTDTTKELTVKEKRLLEAEGQYPYGRYESVYGANASNEIFKAVDECLRKGIKIIEHGSRENPNLATDPWRIEVPKPNGGMTWSTNRVMEVLVTKSV